MIEIYKFQNNLRLIFRKNICITIIYDTCIGILSKNRQHTRSIRHTRQSMSSFSRPVVFQMLIFSPVWNGREIKIYRVTKQTLLFPKSVKFTQKIQIHFTSYATGIGTYPEVIDKEIRWVAIRGEGMHDWCIYALLSYNDVERIENNGDKIFNESVIKRLVPCTDEAFGLYRF